MSKGRMEAFSDGVLAIIITIMVLEMKVPHGDDWSAPQPLIPVFLSYVMGFVYLGVLRRDRGDPLRSGGSDPARARSLGRTGAGGLRT